MREKSSESECQAQAAGHVRVTTEMCSRDPPTLLSSTLAKANGTKGTNNQAQQQQHQAAATAAHHHHNAVAVESQSNGLPGTPGGRLKFFKDGKFILELSHRRDGERTTWFPVPKKTFWPPASTTPNRQESSASLSISDDNSSIQSSPWQRDHCWKQTHPRRNISAEYSFYYRRNPRNRLCALPRLVARGRRRPFDSVTLPLIGNSSNTWPSEPRNSNKKTVMPKGKTLSLIVEKLPRLLDPNVVSPRKRILRELERVSLEDQASKRRATPQPTTPPGTTNPAATTTPTPTASPKQLSSYSITSILGEDKPSQDQGFLRNLLKPEDRQAIKYSGHSYPRSRMDPYLTPGSSPLQHPLYGVQMLPPGPYRAPLWMYHPPPVHFPPQLPLYVPSQPHPSSPPVHHYKDYREQALTPPSDMPLNLSKHAG